MIKAPTILQYLFVNTFDAWSIPWRTLVMTPLTSDMLLMAQSVICP
jgi:hypothetical protein